MSSITLKAQEPVYGGFVLHRSETEGITFIKGALPGELVEVSIEEKKRDYSVGSVVEVVEPSTHRIEPPCAYFGTCGGCHLQFAAYPRQVEMKNNVLIDCLRRLGGIDAHLEPPLYGKPYGYRRRGQFKVSKDGHMGFYRENTHDVVQIESCPLMSEPINSALRSLRETDLKGVREIHLTDGDGVMALIKGVPFSEELADSLMDAGLSGVAFDDGTYRGEGPGYALLDLSGLKYSVSPWSFLQSNWELNQKMVAQLVEETGEMADHRLLDLYAGAGNFSLSLAIEARETVAVEENASAIADGKRNVAANRITGYRYLSGTAETAKLKGGFDVLIVDPPRAGLSKESLQRVLDLSVPRLAYVSCNPSTLARDMKTLTEMYAIDSVRIADMFPQTYHVESIVIMTKK
ncbi:class I SAM-dependent RNA methyltransferase [Nitrospirota bacterium]